MSKVMVTNADGSQTAMTLAQLGITQVNLKTDATEIRFADGSVITGQSTFVKGDGVQTAGAMKPRDERTDPWSHGIRRQVISTISENETRTVRAA